MLYRFHLSSAIARPVRADLSGSKCSIRIDEIDSGFQTTILVVLISLWPTSTGARADEPRSARPTRTERGSALAHAGELSRYPPARASRPRGGRRAAAVRSRGALGAARGSSASRSKSRARIAAARELIARLRRGAALDSRLAALLRERLAALPADPLPADLADAAEWIGTSDVERGRALRDVLRLYDAIASLARAGARGARTALPALRVAAGARRVVKLALDEKVVALERALARRAHSARIRRSDRARLLCDAARHARRRHQPVRARERAASACSMRSRRSAWSRASEAARRQSDRDGQLRVRWDGTPLDLFFAYDALHDACRERRRQVPFPGERIAILSRRGSRDLQGAVRARQGLARPARAAVRAGRALRSRLRARLARAHTRAGRRAPGAVPITARRQARAAGPRAARREFARPGSSTAEPAASAHPRDHEPL